MEIENFLLILVLENSQSHQPTSETLIKQQLFGNIRYHDAFALKEPWNIQHRSLKVGAKICPCINFWVMSADEQ